MLPVVLHHGIFGGVEPGLGPWRVRQFEGVDRALGERGHAVLATRVHPSAPVAERARQLKTSLLQRLDAMAWRGPVLIVAHSMGGLDARHMITHLGMKDRVAALVTVSTPHRGSPLADFCAHHLEERLGAYALVGRLGWDVRGALDLTVPACDRFNDRTPDAPGVGYYSVTCAATECPPWLVASHGMIHRVEGANDGLVSVRSALWGTHMGTWPVDHLSAINRRWGRRPGDFDVVAAYVSAVRRAQSEWGR